MIYRKSPGDAPMRLHDHAKRVQSARAVCEAARRAGAVHSVQIAVGDAAYAGESLAEIESVARASGGTGEQGKAAAAAAAVNGKFEKVVMIPSDRWQDTKV